MFYDVVVNDWGETTYVPTALGGFLLAVLLTALLLAAMLSAKKHGKRQRLSIKQLTLCAMSIALATVLSNLKLFHFPTGGSVTLLSMLVICLPGCWFGVGAGIMTGVAYGILQLLTDPYVLYPAQLITDYLLAFGAMGLSGLFSSQSNGLIKGYLTAILGRYFFAVLSGVLFFGAYAWEGWNPWLYSIVYNGIYIFAEAGITLLLLVLPPVRSAMARLKRLTE